MTAGQWAFWIILGSAVVAAAARVAFLEGLSRGKRWDDERLARETRERDQAFKDGEESERWRAVAVVERLLAAAPGSIVGRAILRELGGVVPPRQRKAAEPASMSSGVVSTLSGVTAHNGATTSATDLSIRNDPFTLTSEPIEVAD